MPPTDSVITGVIIQNFNKEKAAKIPVENVNAVLRKGLDKMELKNKYKYGIQ